MIAIRKTLVAQLLLTVLAPLAGAGCTVAATGDAAEPDSANELGTSRDPLAISVFNGGVNSTTVSTGTVGVGPTYAPLWSAPGYWGVNGRSSNAVSLTWYEPGNPLNQHTQIYRQKYDVNGHAVGPLTLLKTFDGLAQGPASFVDNTSNTLDHSGPDPDSLVCYRLVERYGDSCTNTVAGYSCYTTTEACTYTRATTPHKIGRLQLRIKVSSAASAAAPSDHVQVRLQSPYFPYAPTPYPRGNSTWLDTTQYDFTSGSNITYDLKTSHISDLSDINQITIATPDTDGLCINELELLADNSRAFYKSFGADGVGCQWVYNSSALDGTLLSISFAELRSNLYWRFFSPPNLVPPAWSLNGQYTASFVGYRANELIQNLDMVWGDQLRNPDNKHGDGAGFRNTNWTTTQRIDSRHLHVVQHVIAQDEGWKGNVAADPSYDLVIHNDASCAPKNWCISVENVDAHSSYSGWPAIIPLIGSGIQAYVNSQADGEMQTALSAMGASTLNDPPPFTTYCFPGNYPSDSKNVIFSAQGFGAGSLTLCSL